MEECAEFHGDDDAFISEIIAAYAAGEVDASSLAPIIDEHIRDAAADHTIAGEDDTADGTLLLDLAEELNSPESFGPRPGHTRDGNEIIGGRADTKEILSFAPEPIGDIDPAITLTDMMTLIRAELNRKGFAGHHISSMNEFYDVGIKQIACEVFRLEGRIKNHRDKTTEDKEIDSIEYLVEFKDIKLTKPTTTKYRSGTSEKLYPNLAMMKNLTLSSPMYVDIAITSTAIFKNGARKTRTAELKNHRIGSMICMERSNRDHTSTMTAAELTAIGEEPNSIGGSFIIRGVRWAVGNIESITHNQFHVHRNMYMNEIVRGTFLSKPGDAFENSYQCILRLLNNYAITMELTTNRNEKFDVPFYLIFRALGMTRDRDIIDNIVYGVDGTDTVTRRMKQILNQSFEVSDPKFSSVQRSTDPTEIIQFLGFKINDAANTTAARKDENVLKYLNNNVLNVLDKYTFPHIGVTPEHRIRKLRFLGHLIHTMLRVELGIMDSTDRDSYKNKRVFTAGTSLAKTFKTDFNYTVVQAIRRQLQKDFKAITFSDINFVDSIKQAINSDDLERLMTQSVSSGNKTITIRRNEILNRVSSQALYSKNDLNVKSVMNTIDTPNTSASKQNERADEMRRVHATFIGFIDISQSADTGEKVGMSKQMCCTATISGASSSYLLKRVLLDDPDITPLDDVRPADINRRLLAKVFVNGDWIGCCRYSHEIARRYRMARRHGKIHEFTTIVCEPLTREIYFWTDVGRMLRPLVIVYNNLEEYIVLKRAGKPAEFRQWIRLTRAHIDGLRNGSVSMIDLMRDRVIEYISPEEQENALLAPNIAVLRQNARDITAQYTHCDIDQAIFGLVTLSSPLANHSNAVRNTFFTNHRKQSAGWFATNWAYRIDKNTTFQNYCEYPIVSTIADSMTYPNGINTLVAFCCHGGDNQEDSCVINQSSVDRGLFNQTHYNYEKAELDKNEQFGNPDYARTLDIKKGAIYEHCENGFIKLHTIVRKDYVLIVKAAKIPKPMDQYQFVDKSVIYRANEEVFVEAVVVARNDEDNLIAKVKYSAFRPINVGDKISSRTGNKGIIAKRVPAHEMPYTADGLTPDILVNCHSLPKRMAVNQMLAGLLGLVGVKTGRFFDATNFIPLDIDHCHGVLRDFGIEYGGHRQMFNGKTGEPIDTLMYFVPDVYQQLQKFVMDEHYAMRTGPTSALTHQPLDGKAFNGGLRMGEMEVNVKESHGCGHTLQEKLYDDSDGIKLYVCRNCGNRITVNPRKKIYKCAECGDGVKPVEVSSAWMANVFMHELECMNVKMRLEVEPITFSSPGKL